MSITKKVAFGLSFTMSAAALIGCLAGCGIQNSNNNKNDEEDEVPVIVNKDAEINLVVEGHSDKKEEQLVQTWANRFMEANQNVNITVNPRGGINTMSDIVTLEQEGNLPDICWTAGDQHSKWSGAGYFQDLSDETKFAGSAEFFGGLYDSVVETTHYNNVDRGIWFAPRDYNRLVCFVNVTAFEKCGVEVPKNGWTFDDLETICKKMKTQTDGGYYCKNVLELRDWAPVYTTMMKNFGATYVDENGYDNIGYGLGTDYCPGENVWNWYETVTNEETGYAVLTKDGATFRAFSTLTKFCNSAIVVDTYASLGKYMDAASKNNYVVDVVSFPAFTDADNGKGYVGAGCSGYAITKACTDENREWAWKFLQYCISEQGYDDVASLGVVCPALKSMADKGAWTTYEKSNGEAINYQAFVDTHTEDVDLNYQNVLTDTDQQADLIGYADTFWQNLNKSSFAGAELQFRNFYRSTIKDRA